MNDFLDIPRGGGNLRAGDLGGEGDRAIGIDLGGTNLRAAIFSGLADAAIEGPTALRVLAEREIVVGSDRDATTIVQRLHDVITDLRDSTDQRDPLPIGVGFAGMLEGSSGFVVNSPHLHWHDVPFGRLLREALASDQVGVFNDVNAITFGEYMVGAGSEARDVLAVFVGTGIGGGMICDGRLIEGASGCAAEIGHTKVVIDESARPCECGLRGCVEAYIGGHYLQRRARAELAGGARSLAISIAGSADKVMPSHLDAAAARGDDYSLDLFAEVAPLLGVTLANAVTLLNPAQLILGGGMLSRTPVLLDHVIASLEVAVNPAASVGLDIALATLGPRAGTIGSALLARARYS